MDKITDIPFQASLAQSTSRLFGKFRGKVTDNQDPLNLGRLKASVPEVLRDGVTGWALPAAPYAGDGVGVYMVPDPGAGVWIEFEAGDVSRPVWSGCWWVNKELPKDESGSDTKPSRKIIRTADGLLLALNDGGKTISLSDSDGNNILKFEVQQGQITMKASTKVVVEAPQIELMQKAPHPLVFGDNLLTYLNQLVAMFNAHVHPVTSAPPVPVFPTATPSLLSTKVKCG